MKNFKIKMTSFIMSFIMMIGLLGTNTFTVFADALSNSVHVNVRVESNNSTIVPQISLDVDNFSMKDYGIDKQSDKVTVMNALIKALQSKNIDCTNKNNFDAESSQYGGYNIKTIDNVSEGNNSGWMYCVNDSSPSTTMDQEEIKGGDSIVLYYVSDYSSTNNYSFFDQSEITTTASSVTLNLKENYYDSNYKECKKNLDGAQILVNDKQFNVDGKPVVTDSDGKCILKFDQAGTYDISAEKLNESGADSISRPYCKVVIQPIQNKINVTGIGLDKTSANLIVGGTVQLTPTITPDDATDKNVQWSSSDKTIAAVDQTGKVTAVDEGTTTISANTEDGQYTAKCNVTVSKQATIQVSINITGYKGNILNAENISATDSETVYSVFKREMQSKNIEYVNTSKTSPYISEIADEAERDRGPASGWKYSVNGSFPNVGVGSYKLKQGDKINFIFVHGSMDETPFRDIDGINIDKSQLNMNVGDAQTVTATTTPQSVTEAVKWSSSDDSIATVDGSGNVTAVKAGTATITVSGKYNTDTKAQCTITVGENKPVVPINYVDSINTLIDGIAPSISSTISDWGSLDLDKAGKQVPQNYLTNLEQKLKNNPKTLSSPTDYERTTLGILAAGGDPTNFAGQNLIEKIYDNKDISSQGINAYIYGLIALDAGNFIVPGDAVWTRDKLIQGILNCKTNDGGWTYGAGSADVDMTGMALSALAPYYNTNSDVKSAVDGAVTLLSERQKDDGGFASWGSENSDSAAMAIIGLCDANVDPVSDNRFIKNGKNVLDSLLSYAVSDNSGFGYKDNKSVDSFGTEQGFRAIAAYKLFKEGKGSVYKNFGSAPVVSKSIQITNMTPDASFTLGSDAKVSIQALNTSNKDQNASLLIGLYDANNKLVNYICGQQKIKSGDSSILTGLMKLPEQGIYELKAFVWDSLENMNSLSDSISIPIK